MRPGEPAGCSCRYAEPTLQGKHPAHPQVRSRPVRSGRSAPCTATSSSVRISAGSATRWSTCCCSTWRSIRSTRHASCPARTPLAVYCQETNPKGSWYAHGAAANAIFEMTDDVTFTYRGSWAAEGANTSWEATWRIVGSKGTLLWDGEDAITANVVDGDEGFFRPLRAVRCARLDRCRRDKRARERHRGFPRRARCRR